MLLWILTRFDVTNFKSKLHNFAKVVEEKTSDRRTLTNDNDTINVHTMKIYRSLLQHPNQPEEDFSIVSCNWENYIVLCQQKNQIKFQ